MRAAQLCYDLVATRPDRSGFAGSVATAPGFSIILINVYYNTIKFEARPCILFTLAPARVALIDFFPSLPAPRGADTAGAAAETYILSITTWH